MRTAIALIALLALLASCGGGGGAKILPGDPNDNQNPQTPTYNRSGAAYMPTSSSSELTYSIVSAPVPLGPDHEAQGAWLGPSETTYRRESVVLEEETTPSTAMRVVSPITERRYQFPKFHFDVL